MTSPDWIVNTVGEPLFEKLAIELSGSELQSVLLEVMRHRAASRTPRDLLTQYARDRFTRPSVVDLRASLAVDFELLAAADRFEAIELSPVAPLGVCSSIALTDQRCVLSALRRTEVVSDPTNVLALESAMRLRENEASPVHLATSLRVIRAQPVPDLPGYAQHFRIFVLSSAGFEASDHKTTVDALVLQIETMLASLDRLERVGHRFGARKITLLSTPARTAIADRVEARLSVRPVREVLEHAYYSGGIRYQIWVTAPDGSELPLIDGGTFDWLAQLTSNRRAIYVATGVGAQLIASVFRRE